MRSGACYGTHSMKRMGLTWVAKAGVPANLRRTLGYHVASDEQSMNIYARDAQAGALRAFSDVITQVREGTFDPDSTRSGRYIRKLAQAQALSEAESEPAAEEVQVLEQACQGCTLVFSLGHHEIVCRGCRFRGCTACSDFIQGLCELCKHAEDSECEAVASSVCKEESARSDGSSDSESSDSSGDSSNNESDDDADELAVDEIAAELSVKSRASKPAANSSEIVFQHKANSTLHLLRAGQTFALRKKLACGRDVHDGYRELDADVVLCPWPWCSQCRGRS